MNESVFSSASDASIVYSFLNHDYTEEDELKCFFISFGFGHSLSFLNHDYTEEDEKDELKCFSSASV